MDFMVRGCILDLVLPHLTTHHCSLCEFYLPGHYFGIRASLDNFPVDVLCPDFSGVTIIERVYNFVLFVKPMSSRRALGCKTWAAASKDPSWVRSNLTKRRDYKPCEIMKMGNFARVCRSDWMLEVSRESRALTLAAFLDMGLPLSWVTFWCASSGLTIPTWTPTYTETKLLPQILRKVFVANAPCWFIVLTHKWNLPPSACDFLWFIVLLEKMNECNDRWLDIYYGGWHGNYGKYLPAMPSTRREWRLMKGCLAWGGCASPLNASPYEGAEVGHLLRTAQEVSAENANDVVALKEACSLVPLHQMVNILHGLWGNSRLRSQWNGGENGLTQPPEPADEESPARILWREAVGRLQAVWLDAERWGLPTVGCCCLPTPTELENHRKQGHPPDHPWSLPVTGGLNFPVRGGAECTGHILERLPVDGTQGISCTGHILVDGTHDTPMKWFGQWCPQMNRQDMTNNHCFGGHMPMFYPPGYDNEGAFEPPPNHLESGVFRAREYDDEGVLMPDPRLWRCVDSHMDWCQTKDAMQDWKFQGVRGGHQDNARWRNWRLRHSRVELGLPDVPSWELYEQEIRSKALRRVD